MLRPLPAFALSFTFLLTLLTPGPARAEITRLCNIEIESESGLSFSATEERWLCGDPETTAWKSVPLSQQRLFLRSFLQSKGYHRPVITEDGGALKVQAGERQRTASFVAEGGPADWDWGRRWGIRGKPLSPETLDEASGWARRDLQEQGYPCPVISPLAFIDTSEILLNVRPGPPGKLEAIEDAGVPDLAPGILDRFTAFRPSQPFDIRLLELSSSRILNEDLYLSTYYDVICGPDQKPRIIRRFVPALPRLFTVGVGADTEQGPLARARMKWTRLSKGANSLELTLFGSIKEQSFSSRFRYHFLKNRSSRLHLVPSLSVMRENKELVDQLTTELGLPLAHSWERETLQVAVEAGPVLQRVNTLRGQSPKRVDVVKAVGKLTLMSHLFEYYLTNPRTGWRVAVETSSQPEALNSEQNVHRATLQHHVLWNIGGWDPPVLILGWRGLAGTYLFNQKSSSPDSIPVGQRFALGTQDDIRAFRDKELPGSGLGFFTVLYQGIELRTGPWFPLDLQPFLFFDAAKGGSRDRHLDRTTYYAPGLGLRYDSPVGTIRSTLAKGYVSNPLPSDPAPRLQFYLSLGKEF